MCAVGVDLCEDELGHERWTMRAGPEQALDPIRRVVGPDTIRSVISRLFRLSVRIICCVISVWILSYYLSRFSLDTAGARGDENRRERRTAMRVSRVVCPSVTPYLASALGVCRVYLCDADGLAQRTHHSSHNHIAHTRAQPARAPKLPAVGRPRGRPAKQACPKHLGAG